MALALKRRRRPPAAISVVSMIDVLMIMLIFFMVTSTYLDLDMIPAAERADEAAPTMTASLPASALMIRIAPDGSAAIRGRALDPDALGAELQAELAQNPALQVILLPSPGARMQALVEALDVAARSGATSVKVLRLEARE